MADATPSIHRCLLTMDQRFVASAMSADGVNGAVYTQAGPMPGVPVASTGTHAELQMSGEQGNRTVLVRTQRGGNSGARVPLETLGASAQPGIAWSYEGDPQYRGWDPPTAISAFEFVDRSNVGSKWLNPHVVSNPDGTSVMVVQDAQRYVATFTRARGASSWALGGVIFDAGSAVYVAPKRAAPCLIVLPGNRLACLFQGATTAMQISYSTDNAATWSTPQICESFLAAVLSIGGILHRIRAAYSAGQILAIVYVGSAGTDALYQMASVDQGASFTRVGTFVDNNAGYAEVVAAPSGSGFVVAAIELDLPTTNSSTLAYVRRVASAFDLVRSATPKAVQASTDTVKWGTQAGAVLTAGELAMCADDAGVLYCVGLDFFALRVGVISISYDGGVTWALSNRRWYDCTVGTLGPDQITAATQGCRLMVAHHLNAPTASDSLAVLYLGGPTTVCMPPSFTDIILAEYRQDYSVSWLPYALPEATGVTWTYVSAGIPTVSLTGLGLRIQHGGAGDSTDWTAVPTTTNAQGLFVTLDMRAVAASVYARVRIGDAAASYEVRVTVTPTSIVLIDQISGGTIATIATTNGASGVQIIIAIGDTTAGVASGKVQAWYRTWSPNADREFLVIASIGTLNRGLASTPRIRFGTSLAAATTDVYVRVVQYSQGTDTGAAPYLASTTALLLGQPVGPAPFAIAETGLRVAMLSGPTIPGDLWTTAPAYQYPISRVDPLVSSSPYAMWRSTADNVNARIVWTLTEATPIETSLVGVYLDGANFGTCTLDGWNGAAWVVLGTIDLRIGTGLTFTRAGEIVRTDVGATFGLVADFLSRNVLAGCTWVTGAGNLRRKIRTNTAGRWSESGLVTGTRPTIVLDSFGIGDSAANSNAEIWSTRACGVFRGLTTGYSRYSIRIPAQFTAEGYYTLGTVIIGTLTPIGNPDYSRQLAVDTQVQTTESRNGARSLLRLGRPRRSAQVSYSDGIESSNIHDVGADFVTDFTGGNRIGTPAAIMGDLQGLLAVNDIAPVVYLPVVPVPAAASVSSITAADLMLFGHIVSETYQTDTAAGQEHTGAGRGEYLRGGTLRIEESL